MLLIIGTLILVALFYYWETIKGITTFLKTYDTPAFSMLNPWFLSILLLNLIILAFQYWFYKDRSQALGNKGAAGPTGFPGTDGTPCTISCW
jgi:multisubunit Na+/H+ antiporter MnhB subunit